MNFCDFYFQENILCQILFKRSDWLQNYIYIKKKYLQGKYFQHNFIKSDFSFSYLIYKKVSWQIYYIYIYIYCN